MAGGFLTIETDTRDLIAALDRAPAAIQIRATRAAQETANAIVIDAKARVRRRSGQTEANILAEPDDRGGYWVRSGEPSGRDHNPVNLPLWLEFGTVKELPHKYFFVSADLERGANERRMIQAIQDGLSDAGLG